MKNRSITLAFVVAIGFYAGIAVAADVEAVGAPPMEPLPPGAALFMNLGAAGLLEEYSKYEFFGSVEARIGRYRATIEAARATGITSGYEISTNVLVLPHDFTVPLDNAGQTFLRYSGLGAAISDDRGNLTQVDTGTYRGGVQYLYSPDINTLLAVGVFGEATAVEFIHNQGDVKEYGVGVRADILHKISQNWGVYARAEYFFAQDDTTIPIVPGLLDYRKNQGVDRFYFQSDLVGTFTTRDAQWIPEGWFLRPSFSLVYDRHMFETVADSFGGISSGTVGASDDVLILATNFLVGLAEYRPFMPAPYAKIGIQYEAINGLDLVAADPTMLHSVIGCSMNLGRGVRADLEYGRFDGFDGNVRDQALTVHVGVYF